MYITNIYIIYSLTYKTTKFFFIIIFYIFTSQTWGNMEKLKKINIIN